MKKYLAILLALVLCLSLGVTAFADDVNPPAEGGAAAAGATHDPVTLTKAYTLNGAETEVYPEETLSFTV